MGIVHINHADKVCKYLINLWIRLSNSTSSGDKRRDAAANGLPIRNLRCFVCDGVRRFGNVGRGVILTRGLRDRAHFGLRLRWDHRRWSIFCAWMNELFICLNIHNIYLACFVALTGPWRVFFRTRPFHLSQKENNVFCLSNNTKITGCVADDQ